MKGRGPIESRRIRTGGIMMRDLGSFLVPIWTNEKETMSMLTSNMKTILSSSLATLREINGCRDM